MHAAVAACGVGDVPEGICSCTVLQRATAHRVGVAAYILCAVTALGCVCIETLPLSVLKIGRVQAVLHQPLFFLFLPFGSYILVAYGIEQACTVDAYGRFKLDAIVAELVITLVVDINSIFGHVYFGVLQLIFLAVGELVAPLVGVIFPDYSYLALIDGCFERCYCVALRHACKPGHIALGIFIVHDKQVSVANLVGVECAGFNALAVSVTRVAVEARCTYVYRAQAVAYTTVVAHERFLEESLSVLERLVHAALFNRYCRLLEGIECGKVCCSELAAGIVPIGKLCLGLWCRRRVVVIVATRDCTKA